MKTPAVDNAKTTAKAPVLMYVKTPAKAIVMAPVKDFAVKPVKEVVWEVAVVLAKTHAETIA